MKRTHSTHHTWNEGVARTTLLTNWTGTRNKKKTVKKHLNCLLIQFPLTITSGERAQRTFVRNLNSVADGERMILTALGIAHRGVFWFGDFIFDFVQKVFSLRLCGCVNIKDGNRCETESNELVERRRSVDRSEQFFTKICSGNW